MEISQWEEPIGTGAWVKSRQLPYSNKEKFWTIMA